MKPVLIAGALIMISTSICESQVPDNLVVEGIPSIPPELRASVGRYLEFRGASFNHWHPVKREMLITTRFADVPQLHYVKMAGGARKQLTFFPEPVAGGSIHPDQGKYMVLASLTHFGDKLRAGIDVVGISNFLTFLKNMEDVIAKCATKN